MKKRILYKLNCFIIALIFCLAIFVPFSISIFEIDEEISEIEKRKLSKAPGIPTNVSDIKKFPELFDTYYSDHFGLRDWFTKHYKQIKYSLGDSPSEDVTIGKNGWLFLGSIKKGHSKYNDPIGDFRNVNLYSQEDLKKFAIHMTSLTAWLNDKGIKYVFVIAPNKHTVYFEQLPDYISKINKQSATDQLVDYLNEHTDVSVVDLRGALIKEKDKDKRPLYYKTGTHWNFRGGNIAQYEIFSTIRKIFPGKISPVLYDDSIFEKHIALDRDLETIAGININQPQYGYRPVFGPNFKSISNYIKDIKDAVNTPYTITNQDQILTAVIFRDSFFNILLPYFEQNFKRSTFIWEMLNYSSLIKYIELEEPDVIIEEWVERSLPCVPKIINEFNTPLSKR